MTKLCFEEKQKSRFLINFLKEEKFNVKASATLYITITDSVCLPNILTVSLSSLIQC